MTSRVTDARHSPVSGSARFRWMAAALRLRDVLRPPDRLLREAGVKEGMNVLDFGCGPGSFSLAAARLVGPRGRIDSLDIHPLAIKTLTRRAGRRGLNNIRPVFSDADTGLPAASIDRVLLYDVYHEIGDRATFLRELHRVLKPEGRISFSDHHLRTEDIPSLVEKGGFFQLCDRGRYTFTFKKHDSVTS